MPSSSSSSSDDGEAPGASSSSSSSSSSSESEALASAPSKPSKPASAASSSKKAPPPQKAPSSHKKRALAAPAAPAAVPGPLFTNPPRAAEPPAAPPAAASAPVAAPGATPAKRRKAVASDRRKIDEDEDGPFVLNVDALQGRWRHSSPTLGRFTVTGRKVEFDNGLKLTVMVLETGALAVAGWTASVDLSTAERIVWVKADKGVCAWLFEDDHMDSGVNPENITLEKRRRNSVDYRALDEQLRRQEMASRRSALNSDESSFGEEEGPRKPRGRDDEAQETMTGAEWAALHAKKVAKSMEFFQRWMLSTRTPEHEERLRRRGRLTWTIPVCLTGAGQGRLEKELKVYGDGVRLAHRTAGTVVSVDVAARERFCKLHADIWRDTPLPQRRQPEAAAPTSGSSATGAASADPSSSARRPPPAAPQEERQPTSSTKRPRRLRRMVAESDVEDGPIGATPSAAAVRAVEEPVANDTALEKQPQLPPPQEPQKQQPQQQEHPMQPTPQQQPPQQLQLPQQQSQQLLSQQQAQPPPQPQQQPQQPQEQQQEQHQQQAQHEQQEQQQSASAQQPQQLESKPESLGSSATAAGEASQAQPMPQQPPQRLPQAALEHQQEQKPQEELQHRAEKQDEPKEQLQLPQQAQPAPSADLSEQKPVPVPEQAKAGQKSEEKPAEAEQQSTQQQEEGQPQRLPMPPQGLSEQPTTQQPQPAGQLDSGGRGGAAEPSRAEERRAEADAAPHTNGAHPITEEELGLGSVEEAKQRLESDLKVEEVAVVLQFLVKQRVDAALLERTKIGVTVNMMRKRYKGDKTIETLSSDLVSHWKRVWQLQRPSRDGARA